MPKRLHAEVGPTLLRHHLGSTKENYVKKDTLDPVFLGCREVCPSTEDSQIRFLSENCMPKSVVSLDRQNPFSALRM